MSEQRAAWQVVAIGLRMKLIAVWGLGIFFLFLTTQILLVSLLVPVLAIDLIGRSFCLTAPVERRVAIHCSVICQVIGIALLAISAFWSLTIAVALHVVAATVCQLFAAFFFTSFLGEVAIALGRRDLEDDIAALNQSLRRVTWAGISLGAYLILIVALTILLLMVFYYGGVCVAGPFLMVAWIPGVLLTIPVFGGMIIKYVKTVSRIRGAVTEAATIPVSTDRSIR